MFPTDYNTEIGWVWNPFTAEYSEEFFLALKEKRTSKARTRMTLGLMIGLASSLRN